MSSSSIHLQITLWLLIISPLAFCRFFQSNETLIFPITTQKLHNSSSIFMQRRRLSSSPSIKIPLTHHVTVLTVSLTAGSPPQAITMNLDTGSELPWLHCKHSHGLNSIFNHTKSSSYFPLPCSSPVCTNQPPTPATCNQNSKLCHVAVAYDDGSSLNGNLAQDTFGIGSSIRPAFAFGCMGFSHSTTPEEDANTTGLMGMNRGRLSLVNQMGLSKFSYCFSVSHSTGVLILGHANFPSLPPLKYTPLVTRTDRLPHWDRFAYTVQLEGIKVGSKLLPIPRSAFLPDLSGAGQTILDTGTQFTYLLDPVYKALKTEFTKQAKSVLNVDPGFVFQLGTDLCFCVGSTTPDYSKLPVVTLLFKDAELTVSGRNLLYMVPGSGPDKKYCFTFGNSKLVGIELSIIGNHHQQNVWMEYDLKHEKVGFANDVKCNKASQILL